MAWICPQIGGWCFKGTMQLGILHSSLSLSLSLFLVARGIVGERRGLESGVSGNAALKIDKRLRVVDQSGAFRCIRAGDPALVTWHTLLTSTENTSHQLKIARTVSPYRRASLVEEITRTIRLIVQGRVKLKTDTSQLASSVSLFPRRARTHVPSLLAHSTRPAILPFYRSFGFHWQFYGYWRNSGTHGWQTV